MNACRICKLLLLLLLLVTALLLCACGPEQPPEPVADQPTVIEPGKSGQAQDPASQETDPEQPEEEFPDKAELATAADLTAALAKVESYYFEQSVAYPEGAVFMQVWYKDGLMKLVSSVDGYGLTESYYDYHHGTVVDYYPGVSETARRSNFDFEGENAPTNPKLESYHDDEIIGGESIGRQYCLILQTAYGDKLWVGTKYGFPLRVEYTDSLGERYTVDYKNVSVNTVSDQDVALPADLLVLDANAAVPAADPLPQPDSAQPSPELDPADLPQPEE